MGILHEADAGIAIKDLLRNHGINVATYYKWKSRYGGMDVAELARKRELEAENSWPGRLYAEQAPEIHALQDVHRKKALGPLERREVAQALVVEHGLSVQRACRASSLAKASWYRPVTETMARDAEIIGTLQGLVARHGRWGFWKCFRRLRPDGHLWNPQAPLAGVLPA